MTSRNPALLLLLIIVTLGLPAAAQDSLTGEVITVSDGDTLTLLVGERQHKIRLAGIDAPELGQDFGGKSKEYLSVRVLGKVVTVVGSKTDKYERLVRKILRDGVDMNFEQVEAGMAWHYKEYELEQTKTDREAYATAEKEAREAKIGVWSIQNPQPPWEFRHGPAMDEKLKGKIIGNKNSKVFHWAGCQGFTKVGEQNRILVATSKEAEAAGYRGAKGCSTPKPN